MITALNITLLSGTALAVGLVRWKAKPCPSWDMVLYPYYSLDTFGRTRDHGDNAKLDPRRHKGKGPSQGSVRTACRIEKKRIAFGRNLEETNLTQEELDQLFAEQFLPMADVNLNPVRAKKKIEQALDILKQLDVPEHNKTNVPPSPSSA